MRSVLFVNHMKSQCGVWQMGNRLYNTIKEIKDYKIEYVEIGDPLSVLQFKNVDAIICNYRNTTLPLHVVEHIKALLPGIPCIGIIHEIHVGYQFESQFSHYLTIDPTYPADNIKVFKTVPDIPRVSLPEYISPKSNKDTVVGTFGFATDGKGYELVIQTAAMEFPGCTIRIHMPFATYGDADGRRARDWGEAYRKMCIDLGAVPEITHNYLDSNDLVRYLSNNHLNCLFYADNHGRGVSGAVEYCIAARRPLIISKSQMFRHVSDRLCVFDRDSMTDALNLGTAPVETIYNEWSPERIRKDICNMLDAILK